MTRQKPDDIDLLALATVILVITPSYEDFPVCARAKIEVAHHFDSYLCVRGASSYAYEPYLVQDLIVIPWLSGLNL